MRLLPILTVAAAMAAGPLAAQEMPLGYDKNAPITLEGAADTVTYDITGSKLVMKASTGSQYWEIALPPTKTLLDMGLSADVLKRGAPVTVRALMAKDRGCSPNCKAVALELTLTSQGKTVTLLAASPTG